MFLTLSLFHSFTFSLWAAPNLTDTVAIEQTADTAFAAKSAAMNSARRQIFNNVISRYSDSKIIESLSSDMDDAAILNLIGTTSIANEKASDTGYAADITMTLDEGAVSKWLRDNNVPNYMSAADDAGSRTQVFFDISGGLKGWISLNKSLRVTGLADDADMKLSGIWGRSATATIASESRNAFGSALKSLGWIVSEENGILRVRK
ncbi:MAG: hypothetical protein LBK26_01445 [Rickettsiales bacterium]|nr:hypothetical protein [Rickettsiales bacterium]